MKKLQNKKKTLKILNSIFHFYFWNKNHNRGLEKKNIVRRSAKLRLVLNFFLKSHRA